MRVTNAMGYDETRDSIARDWPNYILEAFPDSKYLFVPNIGKKAVNFIKKWDINVLIISGGDDLGVTPDRDNTESELLEYAIKENIPVIAICRGLQLIHTRYGGKLINGDTTFIKQHRANKHDIIVDDLKLTVNSYHTNMIDEGTIDSSFTVFARCITDNSVEGIRNDAVLALMWHPERDEKMKIWNKKLIENFIRKKHEL